MLKRVTVLNIDDLTAALKPVVLPGEVMSIFVMKEGKVFKKNLRTTVDK